MFADHVYIFASKLRLVAYECQDCDSWGHKSKKSRWCTKSDNTPQKKDIEGGAITAHLAFITQQVSTTSNPKALKLATMSSKKRGNTIPLQHHIFEDDKWVSRPPASQPTCGIKAIPSPKDHSDFGHPVQDPSKLRPTEASAVTDSGCQSTAIYPAFAYRAGFRRKDFISVSSRMSGPNRTDLGVIGAIVMDIKCMDGNGVEYTTKQLCYVCDAITSVYISRQGCQELRLLDMDFPTPRPRVTDSHGLHSSDHTELKDMAD